MGLSAATIAEISTVTSVVGAGIGALGAIQQGKAAKASANYNAQVAANNAAISKQNATFAAQEGIANTEKAQMESRAKYGAVVANQGASGVDVNSGSSVDVRSSAAQLGELNALTVRSNAARQVYGYQTESTNYQAQSQLDTAQAANAMPAAAINAGSTLLGGLGSASSTYANYLQKGGL